MRPVLSVYKIGVKRMVEQIEKWLYRLPLVERLGIRLILGLLISLACLGIFGALAEDVVEKEKIVEIDSMVANSLHAAATPVSTSIYRAISWIGMPGLWLLGLVVGVYFIYRRWWLHLGVWAVALLGGTVLNNVLKLIFARARPSFTDPLVIEQNFSFPSGHSMMSLIAFGLFAYFIWQGLNNRYARIMLLFFTSLLIILIGISRMTLGVHYLSDVVAGFAAGGVWLGTCITVMATIERRKKMGDPAAKEGTPILDNRPIRE